MPNPLLRHTRSRVVLATFGVTACLTVVASPAHAKSAEQPCGYSICAVVEPIKEPGLSDTACGRHYCVVSGPDLSGPELPPANSTRSSAKSTGYFPCKQFNTAMTHYSAKAKKLYDAADNENDAQEPKGKMRGAKLIIAEVNKQSNCSSFNYGKLRNFLLKLRNGSLALKRRGGRMNNTAGLLLLPYADGRLKAVVVAFTRLKREAKQRGITVKEF